MQSIADKKRAIFEGMLDLIKDHGFHGASMSLLAKNAGVAAGTIYHYFESKDQLIDELYNFYKSKVVAIVGAAIEDNISCKEKFFAIWINIYQFYTQNPNVLIFFEQYNNSPYNTNRSPNYSKSELFNFFQEGMRSGQIKDTKPEVLMIITLGSISSMAKLKLFGKVALDRTDLEQVVEILWKGIAIS